jgi:hypothetical protein
VDAGAASVLRRCVPVWIRVLFYACLGVTGEVVFTALCARLGIGVTADVRDDGEARGSWRLRGHSFVWMLPIYGLGLLGFERVHDAVRGAGWPVRGVVYVGALYVVEHASGALLERLTGSRVWRWTGPGARRHVHLAMAPGWLALSLLLEPLHDALVAGLGP